MNWLQSILETIKAFFGLGEQIAENKAAKIPHQKEAIEASAHNKAVSKEINTDKKLDRHRKKEPKSLLIFNDMIEFTKELTSTPRRQVVYAGSKQDILDKVVADYEDVLDKGLIRNQQRKFIKDIGRSEGLFFIIRIAEQTVHE